MAEHRTDDLVEQIRREFVGEIEFDLAAMLAERLEAPFAVQVTKRPVLQRHDDRIGRVVHVVGREMRAHAVVVDVDSRGLAVRVVREHAGAAAPRQELRIKLDAVDELEHLRRRVRNEDALRYAAHEGVVASTTRAQAARARAAA